MKYDVTKARFYAVFPQKSPFFSHFFLFFPHFLLKNHQKIPTSAYFPPKIIIFPLKSSFLELFDRIFMFFPHKISIFCSFIHLNHHFFSHFFLFFSHFLLQDLQKISIFGFFSPKNHHSPAEIFISDTFFTDFSSFSPNFLL